MSSGVYLQRWLPQKRDPVTQKSSNTKQIPFLQQGGNGSHKTGKYLTRNYANKTILNGVMQKQQPN